MHTDVDGESTELPEEDEELYGHIQKAFVMIMENRPKDPLRAMAEYLKNIALGCTPVREACRILSLTSCHSAQFPENVYQAYTALSNTGVPGVLCSECLSLIGALCDDAPASIRAALSLSFKDRNQQLVNFEEFRETVKACVRVLAYTDGMDLFYTFSKDGETVDRKSIDKVIKAMRSRPAIAYFMDLPIPTSAAANNDEGFSIPMSNETKTKIHSDSFSSVLSTFLLDRNR